ncbi:DNA mismatch repair protein MSH4 [Linum perenne]
MDDDGERSSIVIGLIENRAKEVGMAAFNMRSAALDLSQYIETSISYHNTKTLLQFYDPMVIIVPPNKLAADGMVGVSELVDRFYAPTRKGAVMVKSLAAKDPSALGLETYYKQYYLCLAAAAATIKWIEGEKGVIVTNHSLSVTFNGSFNHMNIDATRTRLLRANLLQPLKDIETINARLNCLHASLDIWFQDELMSNEQLFFGLTQVLRKFPKETDRVLCHFCFKPKKVTNDVVGVDNARKSQVLISSIILLKTTLEALPLLGKVLKDANCVLLSNIYRTVCDNEKYSNMRKSNVLPLKLESMDFWILQGEHSVIPVKGFYFSIPQKDIQGKLPRKFIQVLKHGNNVHCSTLELASLNVRNKSAAGECYIRTEVCLEALVDAIREDVSALTLLAEALCLLDMIVNSFAHTISTKPSGQYVRPEFTNDGPLAIDSGRHPILETIHNEFVPNNIFISEASNMVTVMGPNMSGKSTYLQQVCLIVILAQIGCYVPACFATIRVVDRIFTRMGSTDSLESNSSTFMTEMRETAFIMQNVSQRSLIVMDELGRATSSTDGFSIAWSCCEHLLSLKA